MSVKIGGYDFEGPYFSTERLRDLPGIIAILSPEEGQLSVVDVCEASHVRSKVESRGRTSCWQKHSTGVLLFSAYYTQAMAHHDRVEIEKEIRAKYDPPCGSAPSRSA